MNESRRTGLFGVMMKDDTVFWNSFFPGKRCEVYVILFDENAMVSAKTVSSTLRQILDKDFQLMSTCDLARSRVHTCNLESSLALYTVWTKSIFEKFASSPDYSLQLTRCLLNGAVYGIDSQSLKVRKPTPYDLVLSSGDGILTHQQILRESIINSAHMPKDALSRLSEYTCYSVMRNYLYVHSILSGDKDDILRHFLAMNPVISLEKEEIEKGDFTDPDVALRFLDILRHFCVPGDSHPSGTNRHG